MSAVAAGMNKAAPPDKGADPFWVFDRAHATHPWRRAFEEMRSFPVADRRWAVALNWRMDHRVSADREHLDLAKCGCFQPDGDAEAWWASRYLYFVEEICRPNTPDAAGKVSAYCRPLNGTNLIPARAAGFDQLVHVGSLNSILRRVSRGDGAAVADVALRRLAGRGLPAKPLGSSDMAWFDRQTDDLARALQDRGEQVVRQAAGLLLDALGEREPPWWACFAQEIHEVIESGGAAELSAALGLGHLQEGAWLVVWRYRVEDVAPLYRPTAVEANDSPYHFPSPPGYSFGITMPACREVIHRPLRGAVAAASCTGKLLRLEKFAPFTHNEFAALRAGHRERLRREFATDGIDPWIGRHPDPL
jgi:hypothetical protein